MEFKDKLLNFRAENNLTQTQVAEIFGVSVAIINRYEAGKSEPHRVNLIRFERLMKEYQT